MLAEYYFKIKHIKGLDNAKANTFNRRKKLQTNNTVSGTLFKKDKNEKIRYNYLQLSATHKALINLWT